MNNQQTQAETIASRGVAEYSELKQIGITKLINRGRNEFGLIQLVVETADGNQWDYIPEDNLYEIRETKLHCEIIEY
jgi:hypothetical protein